MLILVYFIVIAFMISYIDFKKNIIPDKIIIPAILLLIVLKLYENNLSLYDVTAVSLVLLIFVIPIIFDMEFGGGDLRYGVFCALFTGLNTIGYFIMLSGIIHLLILGITKRRSHGFAPAMSLAAMLSYFIGKI